VREVAIALDCFDARRDATGKLYRYALWNAASARRCADAARSACCAPLDLERIRVARRSSSAATTSRRSRAPARR
jgi:tRNA U38,U39,U40 pseudouridine synthase TruA